MEKSKVWFSDANATNWTESLVCKAKDLFYLAGLNSCFAKGDSVAIKIHVGEYNRTRCLRPELVTAIVEEVKACGGRPFVTDTTTLPYQAYAARVTATMALETAYRHGFTPDALGCPLVIADGWSGYDDVRVDLPEGIILKEAYVASAIAVADAMIAVTHAKGHPLATFGGAIKNIGIGCQSKRGKFVEHLAHWGTPSDAIGWPLINEEECTGLKCDYHQQCMDGCHKGAITIDEKGLRRNENKCTLCSSCIVTCTCTGHMAMGYRPEYFPLTQIGMTDAAKAVYKTFEKGKVGHLAYAIDTDMFCDCVSWAAIPVTSDIGVFASLDPVAIDTAVLDMINAAPIPPGAANGLLEELEVQPGDEKYLATQGTSPRYQLQAGVKLGMGTMEYELIKHEPQMTPENVAKWQIRQEPTGLIVKEIWKKRDALKEAEPFKKVPFDINLYKAYGPAD